MAEAILSRANGASGALPPDLTDSQVDPLGVGVSAHRAWACELENLPTPCNGGCSQEWEEEEGLAGGLDLNVYSLSDPTNVKGRPAGKLVTAEPDNTCHVLSRNSRESAECMCPETCVSPYVILAATHCPTVQRRTLGLGEIK